MRRAGRQLGEERGRFVDAEAKGAHVCEDTRLTGERGIGVPHDENGLATVRREDQR